jgi:hypothetical protein
MGLGILADACHSAALAHKVHDQPRGVVTFRWAAPSAEQPPWIELASRLALVTINVGVFDGAIDRGRIVAGNRERSRRDRD